MASIDYYLKKRKNKEKHPIYLRVTHRRETNLVPVNIKVQVKHWNKSGQEVHKSHPRHDQINKFLTRYRIEIESEVFYWEKKNPLLRSSDIKQRILRYNKTGGSDSVPEIDFFEFAEDLIDGFKKSGKYRREKNYRAVIKKVKDFWKRKKLHFYEVDVTFLRKFELFLQNKYENNPNTIKNNMKKIRKIFNDAIRERVAKKDQYPFDNYRMPSKKVYKTKLTEEEIEKFKSVRTKKGTRQFDAQQLFLFAFYCWGMRFRDAIQLKWQNVNSNRLTYITSKSSKHISLVLPRAARLILNHYKPKGTPNQDSFIFPLLEDHLDYSDPKFFERQVSSKNSLINQRLLELQNKAKIEKRISFHIARHSFAQAARRKGVISDDLKELLGHSDLKTTEGYIESLGEEHLDEVAAGIFD